MLFSLICMKSFISYRPPSAVGCSWLKASRLNTENLTPPISTHRRASHLKSLFFFYHLPSQTAVLCLRNGFSKQTPPACGFKELEEKGSKWSRRTAVPGFCWRIHGAKGAAACRYLGLSISNVCATSTPRRSLQAKSNVKCTSFK